MDESGEAVEWDVASEPQMKSGSSVASVLGSVFSFSSSSEVFLGSTYPFNTVPASPHLPLPHVHHLLPHTHTRSTTFETIALESPPLLRPTVSSDRALFSKLDLNATHLHTHSTPTASLSTPIAVQRATIRTLSPAHHHNYYFRKLPRAYRSPSPINFSTSPEVYTGEILTSNIDGTASSISSSPRSHLLPMNSLQYSSAAANDRSTSSSSRLLLSLKPRSVGVGGPIPASVPIEPVAISDEVSLYTPTFQSTTCKIDAVKPQSRLDSPSTAPPTMDKTSKRSTRYSLLLPRRQGSSSEVSSPRKDHYPTSQSSLSRRRGNPRGEGYIVKKEIETQRGELWDEEGCSAKTMTILPRWKAAFGRSRGKSNEGHGGETPSSPVRRNVFASKSQTDLTRLQKLFREESTAERVNMSIAHSSLGYVSVPPSQHLDSPLVTAAKEEQIRSIRGGHLFANRFEISSKSQPSHQGDSYFDNLPSTPRQSVSVALQPSSDQLLVSHFNDGTSLQPRQKRNRLLRRPGTTQGTYTAPTTPIRARPGTSGESSYRVPFHPASDPVTSKHLLSQRPKTSSGAFRSTNSEQMTPEKGRSAITASSKAGLVCEISPRAVHKPDKIASHSPLLQILRPERLQKIAVSSPSISSPLFHTLKEETQASNNQQKCLLLSPAQIVDSPPKRLSSNEKVKELRETMKALEQAMAFSTEEQLEVQQFDTPGSTVSRFTEAASSSCPLTPYSSQSRCSTISAHTFFSEDRVTVRNASNESVRPPYKGRKEKIEVRQQPEEYVFVEEAGDQTIVPSLTCEGSHLSGRTRVSQQKNIFELYFQDHPVDTGLLSAEGMESRRGSADSRGTTIGTTDSSASFSLDAEFWLVQAAEKRIITARTPRSATFNFGDNQKEAESEVEVEEAHKDDGPSSRPASLKVESGEALLQSRGINILEEKQPYSLKIEVKWEADDSSKDEKLVKSGVVSLTDADIDVIGRAWVRGRASKLSILSLSAPKEGEAVQIDATSPNSPWIDERRALEQRQKEILRISSDTAGVFRVHSAPAYVRRSPGYYNSQTPCASSSKAKRWQRKALVLTPRSTSDQSAPMEEPLRSDGSQRRYPISPQTTSSSSRSCSPNTEIGNSQFRPSRSPIIAAPLSYKRSVSSFTKESGVSKSLPAT